MALSRQSGRAALVLVASAFASAAPLAAQGTHRDVSPTPEVRKLVLNGVSKAIDKDELRANIYTTATSCQSALLALVCKFSRWRAIEDREYLSRQELKRDVLRIRVFYYKRGFRETEVDTTVTQLNEKQVEVKFDIREGPPTIVTGVAIAADSTLLPRRRLRTVPIPASRPAAGSEQARFDARRPHERALGAGIRRRAGGHVVDRGSGGAHGAGAVPRRGQPPDARRPDRDQRHGRDLAGHRAELAHLQARRPVPAQRGAREPAQPVRVEPVPHGHAAGAGVVRQREDGARRCCARRSCTRRGSAPASTRSTTSRPRAASRTTTCSAARAGSTPRSRSATSSRISSRARGSSTRSRSTRRSPGTPTTSSRRRGTRTCSSRSPRSSGGRGTRSPSARSRSGARCPRWRSIEGYGGNADFHALARPARVGERQLQVRGHAGPGGGPVLLRELRRVRRARRSATCARTIGCRPCSRRR